MAMCQICGKKPSYGHNVSHAANATPRRWLPNIQSATVTVNGKRVRMKVCTRCLRTMNKDGGAIVSR